jgi:hypothetical protein
MLWFSPFLFLKKVDFQGQSFVTESELTEFITPFYNRSSIVSVMVLGMRHYILDQFLAIEDVRFQFVSPSYLRAFVKEKTPWVSFWVQEKSILVAQDGTVLNRGDNDSQINGEQQLLIIRGFSATYFQDPIMPHDLMERIGEIKVLTEHYFPTDILQVEKRGDEDWVILLHDTLPIMIGAFDSLEDKFSRLSSFMSYYNSLKEKKTLKHIDLRIRDKIVVRYE